MKFKQYLNKKYEIIIMESVSAPLIETTIITDIPVNFDVPLKNRQLKNKRFYTTDIIPKDRSFKNLPRYANDKPMCRFQDWLCFAKSINKNRCCAKSTNGKWYGWSHRAIFGFKRGFEIKSDNSVARRRNRKLPYKIKDEADAKWHAMEFAREVS